MRLRTFCAVTTLLFATGAHAAWQFDPAQSQITAAVTDQTASGNVTHTHRINKLNGTISDDGQMTLPLKLSQLDVISNLGQLPPWLSSFSDSQMAIIEADIEPSWLTNLGVGDTMTRTLPITVRGDRFTRSERVPLRLERLSQNDYTVTTAEPINVDTQQLMQLENAQTIMSMLGYHKLTGTIPINFSARLQQQ
ncbi:hypothetical protein [Phytohalomonas tamaricis]|uniref:hypothetical protein n=1 Tax=Phytohalomonas tamaricis TaxID=2081032 RepID=UPI000D0B46CB|nr:hypothetical protein [Phytohalomonas tamaricis]